MERCQSGLLSMFAKHVWVTPPRVRISPFPPEKRLDLLLGTWYNGYMILRTQEGNLDTFHTCKPDKRCDSCKIKFPCYTNKYFDIGQLSGDDFMYFIEKCRESRMCSSKAE